MNTHYPDPQYTHARHSSIGPTRRVELEELHRHSKIEHIRDFRKAGIPEDVSLKIKKALEKQKEMLKNIDPNNPYSSHWTKQMLRNHYGVQLVRVQDAVYQVGNRWKIRLLKNSKNYSPRQQLQQYTSTMSNEQFEADDKALLSQGLTAQKGERKESFCKSPNYERKHSRPESHERRRTPLKDEKDKQYINNYLPQVYLLKEFS